MSQKARIGLGMTEQSPTHFAVRTNDYSPNKQQEPKGTKNTGNRDTDLTAENDIWI